MSRATLRRAVAASDRINLARMALHDAIAALRAVEPGTGCEQHTLAPLIRAKTELDISFARAQEFVSQIRALTK